MAQSIGKRGTLTKNELKKIRSFIFFVYINLFQLNIERKTTLEMVATPICKFSAGRSLSCAMELNVMPSYLLINNLGFDIFIVEPTSEKECCVQSNYIIVPMTFPVIIY